MTYRNNKIFSCIALVTVIFLMNSCRSKKVNYINYYQRVNTIDSIYRIAKQPKMALKEYRKLFRKYEPKNQDYIEEYRTYITLADKYHKRFGGKKSLNKLILLVAPDESDYRKLFPLFTKYNMDSIEVKQKVENWKKNLNHKLVDSFNNALVRDQLGRPLDRILVDKNVDKNANLLLWTFKNYGFPSIQKIGESFMPTLLSHMIRSKKYPEIKEKVFGYLKNGDLPPFEYALMADTYDSTLNTRAIYQFRDDSILSKTQVDKNRKSIGLPSVKHASQIRRDYFLRNKVK